MPSSLQDLYGDIAKRHGGTLTPVGGPVSATALAAPPTTLADEFEQIARRRGATGSDLGGLKTIYSPLEADVVAQRERQTRSWPEPAPPPPTVKDAELARPKTPNEYTREELATDWGITVANAFLSVPETIVGLANLTTFGLAGKATDLVGFKPTDWKAYLGQFYSDERKEQLKYVADAKGVVDTAIRALQNPSVIAHAVVESLPSMFVGGAIGRGIRGVVGLMSAKGALTTVGRVAGGAATAAPNLAGRAAMPLLSETIGPVIAGAMGEGAVTAGSAAEQARAASPDRELTTKQALLTAGSGALTGFISRFSGGLARKLGIQDVETMLAGGMANPTARKNLGRALLLGMIQEGVFEEFTQSAQEQMAQNLAQGKDVWDGVDENAVLGMFAGMVMSGGAQATAAVPAVVEGRREDRKRDATEAAVTAAVEGAQTAPTTPGTPQIPRITEYETGLQQDLNPLVEALLGSMETPTTETAPKVRRPDWVRQQAMEADADTRLETAKVIEDLLRRGQLAPLEPNDPELVQAAKRVSRGSKMLPNAVAALKSGTIISEQDGTADETDWTVVREFTPTGPTIFIYNATGDIKELAVEGRAGADLGAVLTDIVAGQTRVHRAPAPPTPPPTAETGGPTMPEAPPVQTPPEPGLPPAEAGPVAGPAPVAPTAPAELSEEDFIRQLKADMEARLSGQTPAAETPPAAAPTAPVVPTPATPAPPAAPAPAVPAPPPAGGIPMMITRRMEGQLKKLGYTPEQISAMKPADAWTVIQEAQAKAAPPTPTEVAVQPPEAPPAAVPTTPAQDLADAAQKLAEAADKLLQAQEGQQKPQTTPAAAPAAAPTAQAPPAPVQAPAPPPPAPASPAPPAAATPPAAAPEPLAAGQTPEQMIAGTAVTDADLTTLRNLIRQREALTARYNEKRGAGVKASLMREIRRVTEQFEADLKDTEAVLGPTRTQALRMALEEEARGAQSDQGTPAGAGEEAPAPRPRRRRGVEASERRDRRDRARQELWTAAAATAREGGWTGPDEDLETRFADNLDGIETLWNDQQEVRNDASVFRAISDAGGLRFDPDMEEFGEIQYWATNSSGWRVSKGGKEFFGQSGAIDGYPGVIRRDGRTPDMVREAVKQDFEDRGVPVPMDQINDLWDAMEAELTRILNGSDREAEFLEAKSTAQYFQDPHWWRDGDERAAIPGWILAQEIKRLPTLTDDEFRPIYEASLASFPANDDEAQYFEAVANEAKRRGMVEEAPPEPEPEKEEEAAPAEDEAVAEPRAGQREVADTPEKRDVVLRSALHSFAKAQSRWEAIQKYGATDEELTRQIANEFGIQGGSSGPYGGYEIKGGKNPRIWFGMLGGKDRASLSGKKLIDAVRRIMAVPYRRGSDKAQAEKAKRPPVERTKEAPAEVEDEEQDTPEQRQATIDVVRDEQRGRWDAIQALEAAIQNPPKKWGAKRIAELPKQLERLKQEYESYYASLDDYVGDNGETVSRVRAEVEGVQPSLKPQSVADRVAANNRRVEEIDRRLDSEDLSEREAKLLELEAQRLDRESSRLQIQGDENGPSVGPVQPSLGPEAEALAEKLKEQPTFEAPFSLSGEAVKAPAGEQTSFFEKPTAQEQIDALRKERDALYKKLGDKFNQASMGFDPEIASLTFKVLTTYLKEGVVVFKDVVARMVKDFGAAKVKVLAPYVDLGWKRMMGQDVSTMAVLEPAPAPTPVPPAEITVTKGRVQGLNEADRRLLDQFGLSVQALPHGSILLTGRTYDHQPTLKTLGATSTKLGSLQYFQLDPAGLRGLLTHLSGLPVPKRRPGLARPHYRTDPRLTRLREDAERRPDESGLDGDPRAALSPVTLGLIDRGAASGIPQFILDEQAEDAYRIVSAYDQKKPMFLLASEPGSGKTFVLGAAIREMKELGAERITYVTVNQALIAQIKTDLKDFGIDDVNFVSYDQLRESDAKPTDVFILDESHKAKNIAGNIPTATKAREWMKLASYTIFSSATPYEDPVQMAYLAPTGVFKQEFQDFESFAFAFGATPKVTKGKGGKKDEQTLMPVWQRTQTSEEDAAAARAWLAKTGQFTSRKIRLPDGRVDSRLVKIVAPDREALVYDAIVNAAAEVEGQRRIPSVSRAWMVNFQKRLLEASKVEQAITETKGALSRKRFPVVFVETKAPRRYDIPDLVEKEAEYARDKALAAQTGDDVPKRSEYGLPPDGIVDILAAFMKNTGESVIDIPPIEQVFLSRFGRDQVAIYTGSVSDGKAQENLEAWRKGEKPVLIVTMAKGGTGLSLHDKLGTHPTTQININLPWTGTNVLQVSQRTARYGLASNAEIEWLFADNILMDRILAARVGMRMSSLGATVHGIPSTQSAQVEDWNLDGAPFSEIAKLNRLMGEEEIEDEETGGALSSRGDVATRGRSRRAVAPRGPGAPSQNIFGLPATAPTGEHLALMPIPEAVELVSELIGDGRVWIVKKFRQAGTLGQFNPNPGRYGIKLHKDLFKRGKERDLAAAFLHEIGHMTDWLPDHYIKRGNLLGRLLVVSQVFRDHHFTRPDGTTVALKDVKDELVALSAQWRPWNRAQATPSFIKYRDSAVELYADALSALFNSPGLVKREAPIFFNEFFAYLDRKPDVKAAYTEIMDRLTGDPERVLAHRQANVEAMFDVGNTKAVDLQKRRMDAAKLTSSEFVRRLLSDFVDIDCPIQEVVSSEKKAGRPVPKDANPVYASEERRQVPAKQKRFMEKFVQPVYEGIQRLGISHSQFGSVFMYQRITDDPVRTDLAQPLGITPEAATEAYERLQRLWGPDKTREVLNLVTLFRSGLRDVLEEAFDIGQLYAADKMDEMRANPAYATYRVLDYMIEPVTAELYQQIGTFKQIQNPFDATVAKALVTIRATQDMFTRRLMADLLKTRHQDAIEQAESYYDAGLKRMRFRPPTAEARLRGHSELVLTKRAGKWEGYYVDSYIARSWNQWTVDKRNVVLSVLKLANSRVFRPLFITYNVGFQAYNLFRDFYRFWKNIPHMSLGKAFIRYKQALPIAKVRAFGVSKNPKAWELAAQDFIHQAEQAMILGITYNELHESETISDQHIENLLAAAHVPGYGKQPIDHVLLRPLLAITNTIKATGDLIETLPKAAGIIEYMGPGSISDIPADQRSFIRRKVGSPDFTTTSYFKPVTNEVFLFSNAITQAVRSDLEVMTDPETRGGYWFKTVAVNILPKLMMAAAAAGLMGDALRRMLAAVSEYEKTNYVVIPLHEDAEGNVTAMKIPQDDMARLLGGLLWKGLAMARGQADVIETLQQVADYSGGQLPSVSPAFGFVDNVLTYATGGNPRDRFRGRDVLSDQEQIARGWPAAKKFIGWEFQQLGGNIIYKFYNGEPFPEKRTWGQRIINLPLSGNVTGRFVSIGQRGRFEEARASAKDVARVEARQGIREREAVTDLMRQRINAGLPAPTGDRAKALARKTARELYPEDRAAQRERVDNILSRLRTSSKRAQGDAFADAVMNAPTIAQKVAVIQNTRRQKGAAKFPTWLRDVRRAGIVSDRVYQAYRQSTTAASQ
jgi:hypothetical protein